MKTSKNMLWVLRLLCLLGIVGWAVITSRPVDRIKVVGLDLVSLVGLAWAWHREQMPKGSFGPPTHLLRWNWRRMAMVLTGLTGFGLMVWRLWARNGFGEPDPQRGEALALLLPFVLAVSWMDQLNWSLSTYRRLVELRSGLCQALDTYKANNNVEAMGGLYLPVVNATEAVATFPNSLADSTKLYHLATAFRLLQEYRAIARGMDDTALEERLDEEVARLALLLQSHGGESMISPFEAEAHFYSLGYNFAHSDTTTDYSDPAPDGPPAA